MSKQFRIMVTQYGYATIEAETEDEALHKVNTMGDGDFDWSSDYTSDDAVVVEEFDEDEEYLSDEEIDNLKQAKGLK